MNRKIIGLCLLMLVSAFFSQLWIVKIVYESRLKRLDTGTVQSMEYRGQEVGEELLSFLLDREEVGETVGLYLLESRFGYQGFLHPYTEKTFLKLKEKWKKSNVWEKYMQYTKSIWNEVKYFPVPEFVNDKDKTVSFSDSWMYERNYGGKRGHEGTDIMASCDMPGVYPVVSMTDGIITNKGWLEKGGYRIGVETPSGSYFYYAHLDSYASIEVGDKIRAGDILGFMGDTGYGVEGTRGTFPVHLHLGIYIYPGEEVSVNPYWVLRYIEQNKIRITLK